MNKVYFIDVKNLKEKFSYEEIYSKVSSYRKNKVDKFMFEKDKWLSLAVEYLLMQALEEMNVDYSKIEIDFIENGKPVLKNWRKALNNDDASIKNSEKELYFNLSHSGKMAMCVIADLEVGCDIQKISDKEIVLDIAERFFHPMEIQMIKDAKEDNKKQLFYRIWTLKESFMKATGKGFEKPLKDFRIAFKEGIPVVYINDVLQENFIFEEIDSGNIDYKSAICMKVVNDCT